MPDASPYILVLSTCPDEATAERLAVNLVDAKVAACVNILGPLRSIYHWKGAVQKDDEMLLIVKTHRDRYSEVERLIVQQHPTNFPRWCKSQLVPDRQIIFRGWATVSRSIRCVSLRLTC